MCNLPEAEGPPAEAAGNIIMDQYNRGSNINFYTVRQTQLEEQKVTKFRPTDLRKTVINRSMQEVDKARKQSKLDAAVNVKALEVASFATHLQQNLSEANVKRTQIDRTSAEALIQKDFLRKGPSH